jgi:ribonuclease R
MSYTSVKKILEDRDPVEMAEYHQWVPAFELMAEVSGLIRKKRQKRGSIDFDFSETKIYLDENGHVSRIAPYERNVATRMIEDFMLLANETVAEHFYWQETPFLYRTHGEPDMDKIRKLSAFIGNFGYTIKGSGKKGEIHPKELQKLLGKIQGTPEEALILRLTLRSMQQARYTTVCSGHFGLAADYYCHFTSPIRRYPDLQIHRIIKDNLRGRLERAGKTEHYREILDEVARQSSVCERRAQEAERESDKLKKAEYMSYHLGEEFEGIISGVTGWGMYVELPNTVEGLVHVNTLRDDYYIFDQENYVLRGEMSRKEYRLGQKIRVRVEDADPMQKTVDFVLAEEPEAWESIENE